MGENVSIPGVKIEFFDAAPSPGCFRIRIGSTYFEIVEVCYRVNREQPAWAKR
jgi:hypothetical protein